MSEFVDLVKQVVKTLIKEQVVIGTVKSVDKTAQTAVVTPLKEGADMLDVRLRATLDDADTGVIIYPVVGSSVMVGIIHNNESQAFIAQYSEFESLQVHRKDNDQTVFKMLLNADGTLNVDAKEWAFNGGALGGLIKITPLQQELQKVINFQTALRQGVNNHVPVPQDGGAALKASILAAIGALPIANFNNIEDTKVVH